MTMTVKILSAIGVLLLGRSTYGDKSQLTVTTPLGVIEGYVGHSVNSQPFLKFEGIPYAKPPIGDLRFEEPQDPEPWKGIWKANVLTGCMQYDHFATDYKKNYVVHGDEDCLHLNVYTHTTDPQAKLDVLVHIHGGAFMFGRGASYGPDIIMDRPIVFVNFNYRLGPLGFISTEDNVLPGNVGLKDQIKALKWVKKNIHLFGGNPDSITLHGMSAGGASVHLHYFLPESKGLFKHGMSQSGCALNPWVLTERVKEKALKIANLVGCPSTRSSEEIKKCLKSKPARHIVHAVKKLQPFLYNPFSPFGVVVDGQWAKKPVLPEHPYKLLKEGKVLDVPWMISYTRHEGLYPASEFWANEEHLKEIDSRWNELLPFILHYNETLPAELKNKVSQLIRRQYMGDKPINRETFASFVDIFSDRLFVSGIETIAQLQSQAVKSNIYCYHYNYRGSSSLSDLISRSDTNIGVSHGDDTILILKLEVIFPQYELSTEVDKQTSKLLIDMTTSFMEKGAPNISSSWPPVPKNPKDPFVILLINKFDDLELLSNPGEGQFQFWDQIPFEENRRLFISKDEL
ncbi:venom carboxylesterase-6-like isoform X1 [Euwallacea similis]|uniref:venom carboxylesterase-6-like isoform X1 n=1 Tax=Euwallacea similis TaxID=1736056 RepID=UPI00344DED15